MTERHFDQKRMQNVFFFKHISINHSQESSAPDILFLSSYLNQTAYV